MNVLGSWVDAQQIICNIVKCTYSGRGECVLKSEKNKFEAMQ